jgi:predicted Rossmann fold flavoprotein
MPSHYDVIVIGAGAAGLMAAGQAAAQGARTLLLEKTSRPGRKILLTGKGRCNLTNTAALPDFIDQFRHNGRFLQPAFHAFFAPDLIRFFHQLGVRTVTESSGRVFPARDSAQEILDALEHWVQGLGVTVYTDAPVERLRVEDGAIMGVDVAPVSVPSTKTASAWDYPQRVYSASRVILTTGGKSYPHTGSTGDGYALAEAVGHTVIAARPALVPLETAGPTAKALQGVSLQDVVISLWINGKKREVITGEMLFTHFGLSGPAILILSGQAVDALNEKHPVSISIDLRPELDEPQLDAYLLNEINAHGKQQFSTLIKDLLPRKLIPVCCDLTGIPSTKAGHQITAQDRKRLVAWLKDFRFEVIGHKGFKEAVITAGGIDTREVDPRSMESKRVRGLYFAGEVLDIDANTGGYNLQAAFSTGWLAGRSAAKKA